MSDLVGNPEDIFSDAAQFQSNFQEETGSPGLTVAVSIDGKTVWSEGTLDFRVSCQI